jgi:hypothetical protein
LKIKKPAPSFYAEKLIDRQCALLETIEKTGNKNVYKVYNDMNVEETFCAKFH